MTRHLVYREANSVLSIHGVLCVRCVRWKLEILLMYHGLNQRSLLDFSELLLCLFAEVENLQLSYESLLYFPNNKWPSIKTRKNKSQYITQIRIDT